MMTEISTEAEHEPDAPSEPTCTEGLPTETQPESESESESESLDESNTGGENPK
jgi:hypothetical protein